MKYHRILIRYFKDYTDIALNVCRKLIFKQYILENFIMVLISKSLKIDRRKVARLISMNNFGHKKPPQFEFQYNF